MSELKFYQKETVSILLEVKNEAGKVVDIWDADIRFRMGPGRKFTFEKKCAIIGLGVAEITLTTTETDLRAGDYGFEWRMFASDGNVSTLNVGVLKVLASLFKED